MKRNDRLMAGEPGAAGGAGTPSPFPKDGQLEVALAIQKVSGLVAVDPAQQPFKTKPDNLFLLTFSNEKVGISDQQMAFFKARLKELLPKIGSTIDGITEDASQKISAVARIVRLALEAVA